MKRYVIFAHGQSVQMFEALSKLVSVSVLRDDTDGFLIVDTIVDGQT